MKSSPPIRVAWFSEAKKRGERFTVLSLYEAWSARLANAAGVRILLVGDSLATSVQGLDTTLPVSMEDMLYHTRAVCRAAQSSFVIADMPFLSHNVCESEAVRNAGRFLAAGASAVKVEGGAEIAGIVAGMVRRGIPVLGHIGMTPQGFAYVAQPDGAPPTVFVMTENEGSRAVFSNPENDFPQRVIYWREGDVLHARIEGDMNGQAQSVEWRFNRAELNARCPAA